jgi:hypothetical protein
VAAQLPLTYLIRRRVRQNMVNLPLYTGQRRVNPYLGVKGSQVQILSSRRSESVR